MNSAHERLKNLKGTSNGFYSASLTAEAIDELLDEFNTRLTPQFSPTQLRIIALGQTVLAYTNPHREYIEPQALVETAEIFYDYLIDYKE